MDNTIILQGSFVSDGTSTTIDLRSGVDWMMVRNRTVASNAQVAAVGVKYYWQNSYDRGAKWVTFKSNAANAANLDQYIDTNTGFFLIDSSDQTPGGLNATITAISAAAVPVVSAIAHGLVADDIVRLIDVTGAQQLGGMEFTVGNAVLTANTFSLDYMQQIVAGTNGSFRKINFDPIFYPRNRFITDISNDTQAVVTLSVTHGYEVGQLVRMVVPDIFEMTEMNNLLATIVDVDTADNTITIAVDSTNFTPFDFPVTADGAFTPAQTVPVGEDTAAALAFGVDTLSDATENQSYIGMLLTGGVNCPGGANGDVIDWVAGKSFSSDN